MAKTIIRASVHIVQGAVFCLQNFFPKVDHCPQSYSQNFKTNAYHHKCLLIWQRKVCRILGIAGVNLLKLAQIICQILSLGLDKDAQLPPSSSADSCVVIHIKDVKCWCSWCIRWTQTIWQLRQAELRQSSKNTIWSSCKDNTKFLVQYTKQVNSSIHTRILLPHVFKAICTGLSICRRVQGH